MISENIAKICAELPAGVKLVAVSKTKPVSDIMEAYDAGQRAFGENYATELRDKAAVLPADIEWHFIGHLQGKQLKYYMPFVSMIEGVDSMAHLEEVERAAAKVGRVVDVLLQVHVAREETKFGFVPDELSRAELQSADYGHVRVRGVMGMATNSDDEAVVRADFRALKNIFDGLKRDVFADRPEFDTLSMGMSHDWRLAVEEGSTQVRLGSSIFGARDYGMAIVENR